MKLVAVTSTVGGAGRTTLSANLAYLLARQGQPVLALELDGQNTLGFLLGMDAPPSQGLLALADTPARWPEAIVQLRPGLAFLPSGTGSTAQRAHLRAVLDNDPYWLRQRLDALSLPDETLVLADTDRYPAAAARHAMAAADLVLGVVPLTPPAYLTVTDLQRAGAARLRFVANWAAAMHSLNNDIFNLLAARLGEAMLPCRIHRDEALPEAAAHGVPVVEHASAAQSARDLQDLADWLLRDLQGQWGDREAAA